MNYPNDPNKFSEAEFDRFLREADDFYANAPGLKVPTDFVARVVDLAQSELVSAAASPKSVWSFQGWFGQFSLSVRLATASAVLLAAFGGIRAGRAATEIIARRTAPPVVETVEMADPLGLAAPEQTIVQLVHHDELADQQRQHRNPSEQR